MHSIVLAAVLAAVVALPARAHHDVAAYDLHHPTVVNGVVREFVWANPHVMLYLEVLNASRGKELWTLEGGSVRTLERTGWTRKSLRPGDRVEVLMAPKRDAERAGRILRVTATQGRVLSIAPPADAH
jgi:Family of unknown function (DUF6152)